MATPGYIESLVGNLEAPLRLAFTRIFDYVLRNLRFGPVTNQVRAENFQLYGLTGTTPAVAGQEFTLAHGLGRVPYIIMPVLALDRVNSQMIPLAVTRAADANRVYLSSTVTSANFSVWVE